MNSNPIISLSGNIGSGKTTVAQIFKSFAYVLFNADVQSIALYNKPDIQKAVIKLLGEESYKNNTLNRKFIASKVFSDKTLLKSLENILHPALQIEFEQWCKQNSGSPRLLESAILFESGFNKFCDIAIVVTAPLHLRADRVISRDNITREAFDKRESMQMPESEKLKLGDYVINNDGEHSLIEQVKAFIAQIG